MRKSGSFRHNPLASGGKHVVVVGGKFARNSAEFLLFGLKSILSRYWNEID